MRLDAGLIELLFLGAEPMPARLTFGAAFNPMRINAQQTALEIAAGAADFTSATPFIDNSYGEAAPFSATPSSVIGWSGNPKYRGRRIVENRVWTPEGKNR